MTDTARPWTDADVHRLATFITGHPDATPDPRHLAATRALLGGLAQEGRLADPHQQDRLRVAERERESLARRCALRFEENEKLRAELQQTAHDRDIWQAEATEVAGKRDDLAAERDELRARVAELEQTLNATRQQLRDEARLITRYPAHPPVAADIAWQLRRIAECPVCSGPQRETTGMVRQSCGKGWGPPAETTKED